MAEFIFKNMIEMKGMLNKFYIVSSATSTEGEVSHTINLVIWILVNLI